MVNILTMINFPFNQFYNNNYKVGLTLCIVHEILYVISVIFIKTTQLLTKYCPLYRINT